MKRLVLTGAVGRLGPELREPMAKMCETLVSTDIVDDTSPGRTFVSMEALQDPCDSGKTRRNNPNPMNNGEDR